MLDSPSVGSSCIYLGDTGFDDDGNNDDNVGYSIFAVQVGYERLLKISIFKSHIMSTRTLGARYNYLHYIDELKLGEVK